MIYLVTGGSGSGKSRYAEELVLKLDGCQRIYIATMKPWDEECRARILRHQAMRAEKGFETVECYGRLHKLDLGSRRPESVRTVLLECMSNLVSNEMFGTGEGEAFKKTEGESVRDRILEGVKTLDSQTDSLVIVTNEVFSDGMEYDRMTLEYQRVLGGINRHLASMAGQVTEVVAGIPVFIKERSC